MGMYYDGLFYTLAYQLKDHKQYTINYIPSQLPDSLIEIHDFIEKLIFSKNLDKINKFDFDTIVKSVAIERFKSHPPPPPPSIKEPKFNVLNKFQTKSDN